MENKEKIIEKLRKLLALSGSSNQHEAELALAKFNELLTTHQLSMSDIEVKQQGAVGEEQQDAGRRASSRALFLRQLALACANLNNCDVVMHARDDKQLIGWIGKKDDIAVAKMLYEHLLEAWASIYKNYLSTNGLQGSKKLRTSHSIGFVHALHTRVKELIKQREDALRGAKTTGTALILLSNQLVQDYIKDNYTNLRQQKSKRRNLDSDAYVDGMLNGKRVPLGGAIK